MGAKNSGEDVPGPFFLKICCRCRQDICLELNWREFGSWPGYEILARNQNEL